MSSTTAKKYIAIVDEELSIQDNLKKMMEPYDDVEVYIAGDAGEILKLISKKKKLRAIILDLAMPYGNAKTTLKGRTDPQNLDAGIRVLRWLREKDKDIWVSVLTARAAPEVIREVKELLGQRGRIYLKPANNLEIENDLACALEIPSKVPQILLGANYRPPILGGSL